MCLGAAPAALSRAVEQAPIGSRGGAARFRAPEPRPEPLSGAHDAGSRRRRALVLALLAALCVPCQGCCTLARLFCGPDKSPWVPISYDTPEATRRTCLEAIRRDGPTEVYHCLAPSYIRAQGLDNLQMTAGWERLREQVPNLHMAGYAEVPAAPTQRADGGVTYELDLYGKTLRVDLVRLAYRSVRYRDDDGQLQSAESNLEDTLNGRIRTEPAGREPDGPDQSRIVVEPWVVVHPYYIARSEQDALPLDRIDFVGIGRQWKIANLVPPQ